MIVPQTHHQVGQRERARIIPGFSHSKDGGHTVSRFGCSAWCPLPLSAPRKLWTHHHLHRPQVSDIQLGVSYFYQLQGYCEHITIFTDIRSVTFSLVCPTSISSKDTVNTSSSSPTSGQWHSAWCVLLLSAPRILWTHHHLHRHQVSDIQLGVSYFYQLQGYCEHIIIFTDIRSVKFSLVFPPYLSETVNTSSSCTVMTHMTVKAVRWLPRQDCVCWQVAALRWLTGLSRRGGWGGGVAMTVSVDRLLHCNDSQDCQGWGGCHDKTVSVDRLLHCDEDCVCWQVALWWRLCLLTGCCTVMKDCVCW